MSVSKSLARPSLGGWLSISNLLLIIGIAIQFRFGPALDHDVFAYLLIALTLPLAWLTLMPTLGGPSTADTVLSCLAIGLNSLAWGYGLAAILKFTTAGVRRIRLRFCPQMKVPTAS